MKIDKVREINQLLIKFQDEAMAKLRSYKNKLPNCIENLTDQNISDIFDYVYVRSLYYFPNALIGRIGHLLDDLKLDEMFSYVENISNKDLLSDVNGKESLLKLGEICEQCPGGRLDFNVIVSKYLWSLFDIVGTLRKNRSKHNFDILFKMAIESELPKENTILP
jgi:hypothetical protein